MGVLQNRLVLQAVPLQNPLLPVRVATSSANAKTYPFYTKPRRCTDSRTMNGSPPQPFNNLLTVGAKAEQSMVSELYLEYLPKEFYGLQ